MRFMVSLIGDESFVEQTTPEQLEEMLAEMDKFNDELKKAGVYVEAEGLGPSASARTLRYGKDGKAVVTDGPFAESKEQIAGYWILECKDLDEAVEWAQRSPVREGAIEIRAIPDTAEENI
ncbi:MAG: YciI family protein [Solirubrobacterales bacterium]